MAYRDRNYLLRGIIGSVPCRFALCFPLTLLLCSCGPSPLAPSTSSRGQETATARPLNAPRNVAGGSVGGERHRHRNRSPRGGQSAQRNGSPEAGKFDFYVISLSWSPGFCATAAGRNDAMQCGPGRQFAFVLHGLWPQYEQGGWPQDCSTEVVAENLVNSMLNIMPSPRLVAHEWQKHGTCSGLSPKDYFEEAADAFNGISIPAQYKAPRQQITVSPDQLRREFASANPKIGEQGFVVLCSGNGRYLQEVRACLTQELEGRPCPGEVLRTVCKSDQIIMRPLR